MMKEQIFISIGPEHYNMTGVIRSLGEAGKNPIYISWGGKARIASTSKYVKKCHYVDSISEAYQLLLSEYGDCYIDGPKPFIFTIDDQTQSFIDFRFNELRDRFIFFNAGKQGKVNEYMDKYNIVKLAQKNGLCPPCSAKCVRGELLHQIDYPVITKAITPAMDNRKKEVFICNSESELKNAYSKISGDSVLVQHFVEKKTEYVLLCCSINNGKDVFFGATHTQNYNIKGYYSPYMKHSPAKEEIIMQGVKRMIREIEYEGLFSVEFLVDYDNSFHFLEINFRSEAFHYASTVAGMNLFDIWVYGMTNGVFPRGARIEFQSFNSMVEPIDYQKRVVERGMDMGDWMKELLECKCLYYFNSSDPEPFYEMLRNNEKLR